MITTKFFADGLHRSFITHHISISAKCGCFRCCDWSSGRSSADYFQEIETELLVKVDVQPRVDGTVGVATPEAQEHDVERCGETFWRESPRDHVIRVKRKPTKCKSQKNRYE